MNEKLLEKFKQKPFNKNGINNIANVTVPRWDKRKLLPGCSGFHGCKNIEQQATVLCPEDVQISGGGISQLGRSFSMNYSEVTISNSSPQHGWIFY